MGQTAAWVAALVLVAAMNGGAGAQAPASAPALDPCYKVVMTNLSACLEYVDPVSNKTKPAASGECCGGLKAFLEEDFDCICSLINVEPGDYPIPINRAKALSLPGACNIAFPSVKCSGKNTTRLPENRCFTPLLNSASTCIDYVEQGSNKGDPPYYGDCCNGVRNFVKNEPSCVCSLFGNQSTEYAIPLDIDKAIRLSEICKATVEEVSKCYASSSPTGYGPPTNAAKQSFTPTATALLSRASLAITSAFF